MGTPATSSAASRGAPYGAGVRQGKGTLLVTDPTVRAIRPDTGVKLAALRLPELQALAAELGISGASKLRKGELVDTISEIQTAVGASSPAQNDDAAQAETAPAAPAAPGAPPV